MMGGLQFSTPLPKRKRSKMDADTSSSLRKDHCALQMSLQTSCNSQSQSSSALLAQLAWQLLQGPGLQPPSPLQLQHLAPLMSGSRLVGKREDSPTRTICCPPLRVACRPPETQQRPSPPNSSVRTISGLPQITQGRRLSRRSMAMHSKSPKHVRSWLAQQFLHCDG